MIDWAPFSANVYQAAVSVSIDYLLYSRAEKALALGVTPGRKKRFEASVPESEFPTATFALEWFFGLSLGCCASAVRTPHRANLCQRAVRSYFKNVKCGGHPGALQSTSHRHPFGMLCVGMHFRFHDVNGEVRPGKSIS